MSKPHGQRPSQSSCTIHQLPRHQRNYPLVAPWVFMSRCSVKLAAFILAILLLVSCAPAPVDQVRGTGVNTARNLSLSCFSRPVPSYDGVNLTPSCDALCAEKGAACTAEQSNTNPAGCSLAAGGFECRCCRLSE